MDPKQWLIAVASIFTMYNTTNRMNSLIQMPINGGLVVSRCR